MSGTLYLCATPIGNLEDITLRVLRLLEECDLVAAEDTRHTLTLLNHFNIKTPLTSYHEHNKVSKGPQLIEKLKEGLDIALVTDAGMPGISDPGADMVKLCEENGITVTVAPGASAALTALVLSGLDTRRAVFEGFLPPDKKERRAAIERLVRETRSVILYEAPHRLKATLGELYDALGERECAAIKEITKKYETVKRGTLAELMDFYEENPPKGEFVLVLAGVSEERLKEEEISRWENISAEEHVRMYEEKGMSRKDAMKAAARDRGISKRDIYAALNKEE